MQFDITITKVETVRTAVVRDRVSPKALARFVPAACGEVWSFIRSARLQRPGRHVALYKGEGWLRSVWRFRLNLSAMIAFTAGG